MIFVTVGTHEQPFNRLVEKIDKLKETGIIDEDVVIQIGYSTYEPQYCKWSRLYSYNEMLNYVENARVVITHGGPSSFIMPLQIGKIPIVIPRQKQFEEHVNDHQVEFCNEVAERQKNIIVITDIEELGDVLQNYDEIMKSMDNKIKSNNEKFIEGFNTIVDELFVDKKKRR